MVPPMRAIFPVFCASLGLLAATGRADEATMQADIDQLKGSIEALAASNADLQKRLVEAYREIRDLREDLAKAAAKSSVEDLKEQNRTLASKIEEVDKKRLNDASVVQDQLERIAKLVASAPITPAPRPAPVEPKKTTPSTPPPSGEMYTYTIVAGDTLSAVVEAWNKEFKVQGMKTVSMKKVLDANPGLDPKRLLVGKKIFIPVPE